MDSLNDAELAMFVEAHFDSLAVHLPTVKEANRRLSLVIECPAKAREYSLLELSFLDLSDLFLEFSVMRLWLSSVEGDPREPVDQVFDLRILAHLLECRGNLVFTEAHFYGPGLCIVEGVELNVD